MAENVREIYRQGDVLFVRIDAIPDGARPVSPGPQGYVLAEGESTGHAHVLEARPDVAVGSLGEALFISAGVPVAVRHQEHAPALLPEGDYRVVRQVEYTPGDLRRVMD